MKSSGSDYNGDYEMKRILERTSSFIELVELSKYSTNGKLY